jgi:hypothetical protein
MVSLYASRISIIVDCGLLIEKTERGWDKDYQLRDGVIGA